jgi:hypothetical protein
MVVRMHFFRVRGAKKSKGFVARPVQKTKQGFDAHFSSPSQLA